MAHTIDILIIEDNIADSRYVEVLLREITLQKYHLQHRRTLAEGVAFLEKEKADIILLDLSLPDSFGLDTLKNLNSIAPLIPIIVLTGLDDENFSVQLVEAGAQDYIVKGEITRQLLSRSIRYAIKRKEMETNLKETNRRIEEGEKDIILKNEDLERANKVLDKFVNVVSHELKKPVANIIGLLSVMEPEITTMSEKGKGVYDKIKYSAGQLKKMISDLLEETKRDYARDANYEMIDLAKIFEEVMLGMEQFITDSKATISLDFTKAPSIYYPYQDLKSIISNLLSNAIKHRSANREPHVKVESNIEGEIRTMCFTDNGKGMDLDKDGDLLFRKYQRFNTDAEGSGLGLWIVKGVLEKNRSRIEVESHPDQGTMFKIFF